MMSFDINIMKQVNEVTCKKLEMITFDTACNNGGSHYQKTSQQITNDLAIPYYRNELMTRNMFSPETMIDSKYKDQVTKHKYISLAIVD